MNKILFLIFLLIVAVICSKNVKEHFHNICPNPNKLVHGIQYSFFPYGTQETLDIGRRGCHSSKYWDCVHKHPQLKTGDPLTPVIHSDCARYSNKECEFPGMLSHSKQEPYYQYHNSV